MNTDTEATKRHPQLKTAPVLDELLGAEIFPTCAVFFGTPVDFVFKWFLNSRLQPAIAIAESLAHTSTQKGISLAALSDQYPLLLVFLRHFG